MESNIWFHTFGTAAQVMASLVGLFAVFVVYKIQEFGQLITEARLALHRIFNHFSVNTGDCETLKIQDLVQMTDIQILKKFDELLALRIQGKSTGEMTTSVNQITYGIDNATYDYFNQLVTKKVKILKELVTILSFSFTSIVVALVAPVFTNVLLPNVYFFYFALSFFILTLFVTVRGIYEITLE